MQYMMSMQTLNMYHLMLLLLLLLCIALVLILFYHCILPLTIALFSEVNFSRNFHNSLKLNAQSFIGLHPCRGMLGLRVQRQTWVWSSLNGSFISSLSLWSTVLKSRIGWKCENDLNSANLKTVMFIMGILFSREPPTCCRVICAWKRLVPVN